MKKKLLIVSIAALAIITTGCVKTPLTKDGEEVVASVKGKTITADELYKRMKEDYGSTILSEIIDNYIVEKEITDDSNAKTQAEAYVENLKKNYEQQGYDWNSLLLQNGFTSEDELLDSYITYYLKQEVAEKYIEKGITDEEISEYYKTDVVGNITARHILIKPETTDDMTDDEKKEAEEAAYNLAVSIIKKLDNDKDFATLAKKYSDDTASAEEGGLLTAFNKQSNLVPEFIDAAVELKVGEYSSEPVKSDYGYHIIYIESKEKKPALKEVKDTIIDALVDKEKENDTEYYNNSWTALRSDYNLKIFDTILNEEYEKQTAK